MRKQPQTNDEPKFYGNFVVADGKFFWYILNQNNTIEKLRNHYTPDSSGNYRVPMTDTVVLIQPCPAKFVIWSISNGRWCPKHYSFEAMHNFCTENGWDASALGIMPAAAEVENKKKAEPEVPKTPPAWAKKSPTKFKIRMIGRPVV